MKLPMESERSVYSLQPREVALDDRQLEQLASATRSAIDQAFLFSNYTETLATIQPLEIAFTVPNFAYSALTQNIPYDRAYAEATIDRRHDGSSLQKAKVRLFRRDWIGAMRSELTMGSGDQAMNDAESLNSTDLGFYIDTPPYKVYNDNERIRTPLNYNLARELLNHVVSQASPVAWMIDGDRNLLNSIEVLMATSQENSLSRSAEFRHEDSDTETVITIHDRALFRPGRELAHTYHEMNISKTRTLGQKGVLAATLQLRVPEAGPSATFGMNYTYDDIDGSEQELDDYFRIMSDEHRTMTIDFPEQFTESVRHSLSLLATRPTGSTESQQFDN